MKTSLLFICVFLGITNAAAQLKINMGVDTTTVKSEFAIDFFNQYISDCKADNQVNYDDYFYHTEISKLYYPDKVAFGLIGDECDYCLGEPYLLALDVKSDTIKAKIMFAEADTLRGVTVYFIANYYLKIDSGKCRFLVTQNIESRDWKESTIRNVTFHYPPYHKFNKKRANKLINSITRIEQEWQLEPIAIDYYFANTNQEIQALKGFDFNFYMARSEYPGGLAYQKEKSIFCWGYNENYFHEFVHLYLNPIYPKTPLKEGIATFYGGSLGKSYKEHIIRLNAYLENYPDIDISNPNEFWYMDEATNPQYAIQALICHLVFEKLGIEGLRELLLMETWDAIYKQEFNIEPNDQNAFLREQIKKYVATQKILRRAEPQASSGAMDNDIEN